MTKQKKITIFFVIAVSISVLVAGCNDYLTSEKYKLQYGERFNLLRQCILSIATGDKIESISKYVVSESKLNNIETINILRKNLKKVDVTTVQIANVKEYTLNGVQTTIIDIYFNKNKKTMMEAIMERKPSDSSWKIKHVFLLEHYFDEN